MKSLNFIFYLLFIGLSVHAQTEQNERQIHQLVQGLAEAWTDGDAKAWAQYFSDRHDFITWFGMYQPNSNRIQNEMGHQRIFDSIYKNTHHHATVDKIRFLSEDVALIHVLAAITPKDAPKPDVPEVIWTGVLQKESGQWKIVSFHNLDLEILKNEEWQRAAPVPVDKMFASWHSTEQ